ALRRVNGRPDLDKLASTFWHASVVKPPPAARKPHDAQKEKPKPKPTPVRIEADFDIMERTDHNWKQVCDLLGPAVVKVLHAALAAHTDEFEDTPAKQEAWTKWTRRTDGGRVAMYRQLFGFVEKMGFAVAGWPETADRMLSKDSKHQPGVATNTLTVISGDLKHYKDWDRDQAKLLLARLVQDPSFLALKRIDAAGKEVELEIEGTTAGAPTAVEGAPAESSAASHAATDAGSTATGAATRKVSKRKRRETVT
ncbi:unnamed protein product, partial [Tilletia controversa]